MTGFPLPATDAGKPPAFADLAGCNDWLAAQPLVNAPLMQEVLADQLDRLNGCAIAARERFKIVETLRKAVFAIETESIKRYEYRPLPLSPVEQKTFAASCRLWRGLTTGYLHCLRACLDGDDSLAERQAKICHRTLTSLRLEQLSRYRAGAEIPGDWWQLLHAALAATDQLDVGDTAISDRLFAETRESTPKAQYAMAILLHLSRPYELSRSQFSATRRWLARWRERAALRLTAAAARDSRSHAIDLESDTPVLAAGARARNPRWLTIDGILAKFKNRIQGLRDGQNPEDLKLGTGLPADACVALLQYLHGALQTPPPTLPANAPPLRTVGVQSTVDSIYLLLGGKRLGVEDAPTAQSNRRVHEQIAIFGHAVDSQRDAPAAPPPEDWQLLAEPDTPSGADLSLRRAAGSTGERISSRSLIAVVDPQHGGPVLAMVRSVVALADGTLFAVARRLPGEPRPIAANGREKMTNRIVQHPALYLPAAGQVSKPPASLFIPAGALAKLTRLDAPDLPPGLKLGAAMDRGANYERLRCE